MHSCVTKTPPFRPVLRPRTAPTSFSLSWFVFLYDFVTWTFYAVRGLFGSISFIILIFFPKALYYVWMCYPVIIMVLEVLILGFNFCNWYLLCVFLVVFSSFFNLFFYSLVSDVISNSLSSYLDLIGLHLCNIKNVRYFFLFVSILKVIGNVRKPFEAVCLSV